MLNICSNDENVGDIERLNCTIKEQFRGVYNTLPFNKLPGRMIVELVAKAIFWMTHYRLHLLLEVTSDHVRSSPALPLTTQSTAASSLTSTSRSMNITTTPCRSKPPGPFPYGSPATTKGHTSSWASWLAEDWTIKVSLHYLSHRTSSMASTVSCAAIQKLLTFETGIGAPSSRLRTVPMITETIPHTLRQTTIAATMNMRVTKISIITTTYIRPLTKKWHMSPQEWQ